MKKFFILALLAAPAWGTIEFNDYAAITANGSHGGTDAAGNAKISYGGGLILHVAGTFDGATVSLEVNAGAAWIAADTCAAMTAAQVCRAAIGPVSVRLTVTDAGASTSIRARGFEVQAVVASSGGAGAADWATITGGTSTEAFLVGTAGSFGPTGAGTVFATSAAEIDADADATPEVSIAAGKLYFDADDDGAAEAYVSSVSGSTKGFHTPAATLRLYYSSTTHASTLNNTGLSVNNAVGAEQGRMGSATTSATVPSYLPYAGADGNSGIGRDGTSGGISIIDNATEVFRAVSTYGMTLGCKNFGKLSTAPSGALCDRYYDTDLNTWCTHNGTNWLNDFTGLTTCS